MLLWFAVSALSGEADICLQLHGKSHTYWSLTWEPGRGFIHTKILLSSWVVDFRAIISDGFHGSDPNTREDLQMLEASSLLSALLGNVKELVRQSQNYYIYQKFERREQLLNYSFIPGFNQLLISWESF